VAKIVIFVSHLRDTVCRDIPMLLILSKKDQDGGLTSQGVLRVLKLRSYEPCMDKKMK